METLNKSIETATKSHDLAKQLLKSLENVPVMLLTVMIAPMMMKEFKTTDPELYYEMKSELKKIKKAIDDLSPKLGTDLEKL